MSRSNFWRRREDECGRVDFERDCRRRDEIENDNYNENDNRNAQAQGQLQGQLQAQLDKNIDKNYDKNIDKNYDKTESKNEGKNVNVNKPITFLNNGWFVAVSVDDTLNDIWGLLGDNAEEGATFELTNGEKVLGTLKILKGGE